MDRFVIKKKPKEKEKFLESPSTLSNTSATVSCSKSKN